MIDSRALGRLERIDLREIWRTEAQDFTPWLARPENLAVLSDALKIELELEAQERNVGPFRADLLCKDTLDDSWVLIENQLERTDHIHLGQLLTYASGLQTVSIVWIAARFTDEHRAVLDWLNEITDEKFRFFGLEVELWRIGNSPAAPKFNVVSKPNEWSRSVGEAARQIESEDLTDTRGQQLRFWQSLQPEFEASGPLRAQKPFPQHWTNFAIGRAGFQLSATLNSREQRIGVELYIGHKHAKAMFGLLLLDRQTIESELGFSPEWLELPDRNACRIVYFLNNAPPQDETRWPEYRRWMVDHLGRLNTAFRPRVRSLDPSAYRAPSFDAPDEDA